MEAVTSQPHTPAAIRTDLAAIFVSLELSRSTWLITSLSPGNGEKMSKHSVAGAMWRHCCIVLRSSKRRCRAK